MVLASCSGEGGASLARRNYGETTANRVDKFPHWFCLNFQNMPIIRISFRLTRMN